MRKPSVGRGKRPFQAHRFWFRLISHIGRQELLCYILTNLKLGINPKLSIKTLFTRSSRKESYASPSKLWTTKRTNHNLFLCAGRGRTPCFQLRATGAPAKAFKPSQARRAACHGARTSEAQENAKHYALSSLQPETPFGRVYQPLLTPPPIDCS